MRPSRTSILVVEDDAATARVLVDTLQEADYRVWLAVSGQDALGQLDRALPHLILLDLILPDMDGLVLCSVLKSMPEISMAHVPIVICSASSRRGDPVLALKLGADDFIKKPFDVDQLLARIEAVLRRASPGAPRAANVPASGGHHIGEVRVGELVVDVARRRALLGGVHLVVTPTEFRVLSVLAGQVEEVLSRDRLAREVWGDTDASNGRTIDVHIRRLRSKLAGGPVPGPAICRCGARDIA